MEEKTYTVTIEATLSLKVMDVEASSGEEATARILDELPCGFCGTSTGLTILQANAVEQEG